MVVLDGERHEVDVDPTRSVVRVGDHEWPYQLVATEGGSMAFEVLGERIEVRSDSSEGGAAESSLVVNGELHTLHIESISGSGRRTPAMDPRSTFLARGKGSSAGASEGTGHAIFPPMPGKVLEVRVREGDRVHAGQLLLVVEAMKMRNEVTSPVAGEVSDLRVTAGTNVTAGQVLLRVVPV